MTYSSDELFVENEQLESFGENIGRSLKPEGSVAARRLAAKAYAVLKELGEIHDALSRQTEARQETGAEEWLLDNWYLARREGLEAINRLRAAGTLRAVREKDGTGVLLYEIAQCFVRSGHGSLTAKRCELFLSGVQKSQPLTGKELGLFVSAVRCALIARIVALAKEQPAAEERKQIQDGMAQSFSSLRLLSTLDLSEMLARVDRTEQILRRDPTGEYPLMDERTRLYYRRRVERLAEKYGCMEHRVAQKAIQLAESAPGGVKHVGYYLFTKPLGEKQKARNGTGYIACRVLLTLFLSVLAGFLIEDALAALLLLFPVSELVENLMNTFLLRILPPAHVPRMELREGIPTEGRTICAVSVLLSDEEQGRALARSLEEYRLANRDAGENLLFAILADLPETEKEDLPDAQKWINAAAEEISYLNEKYGGGFFLLCRERAFCRKDGKYRGRERKRGAIMELARLLHGEKSELYPAAGDRQQLAGVRYILALDADTRLCPGTARELVGAMLHPLNRPVFDEKRRVVTEGYGVIAPRMSVELPAAGRSLFSRIFAGMGGMDPYGSSAGEVYMDLLGRGGFAGKGIFNVEMLLSCLEARIPEERVLSHDILEGAYLRCGYMSDVELTDEFPSRPTAWFRRLERWTRGDWQNIPWLFHRGKVLPDAERWRIFDNIRRSLVAPTSFACIFRGLMISYGAGRITALLAFGMLLINLFICLAETTLRPATEGRIRYHSTVICGVRAGFLQTVSRLLLLPAEATITTFAILTALWRMLISHRNMLRWQTAAQVDSGMSNGIADVYGTLWACPVYGALCIALSPAVIGIAAGLIWLLSPLFAYFLGKENERETSPDEAQREYLLACAKEQWHYFEQFCTAEDHFLPPDNFQQSPPVGVAHRTSPTNIGLCLLCALAADDLNLAPTHRCMGLIANILDTLERLPKWHGHLYNWIDTQTLELLHPAYISTVDSGNLAGCLIALKNGLQEKGRSDLALRAEKLYAGMDFSRLYDEKRHLFRIGWDADAQTLTEGWYDLLSSEARLTGYVAIAKGDVPRRHWRRLSRAQLQKGGYRGMASWTGTVFEYLMPELLLPSWRDSLLYESARFCLYCHRKRTSAQKLPWGASESAFSLIDSMLNYRYKAHGVSALALQRGMDEELVIAPYASFLALAFEPDAAEKNLHSLERIGARGAFGFWDAVDFTQSRLSSSETHRVVYCVMAHHVGMSLIATANRLEHDLMRRRFMAEPAMSAYAGLLQEKVPTGGVLLRSSAGSVPDRTRQKVSDAWERSGTADFSEPEECCLLSNGFYNIMLTETGGAFPSCRELVPYLGAKDSRGLCHGMDFFLERKTEITALLPTRESQGNSWKFRPDRVVFSAEGSGFTSLVEIAVAASEPGERRTVILQGTEALPQSGRLLVQFEAVLARLEDYVNHPAYFGLGLFAKQEGNVLLVRRLARAALEECWLAVACSRKMEVFAFRDRNERVAIGDGLWLTGGRLEAATDVILAENMPAQVSFALCVAKTATGARDAALRTLHLPDEEMASLPGVCAALLGLRRGLTGAYALLERVHFSAPDAQIAAPKREALWQHGVSGDLPIVSVLLDGEESIAFAGELLREHALLSVCGQKFDLVFLDPDGGDYRRATVHALWKVLRELDRERSIGERGGVHFVADTSENRKIFAGAGILLPEKESQKRTPRKQFMSTTNKEITNAENLSFSFAEDGVFQLDTSNALPPRTWSNILTNGAFGCIATEYGMGHMWLNNAREAQITRWSGDAYARSGPETLQIIMSTKAHSLFSNPGDGECRVEYGFGTAVWQRKFDGVTVRTSAFVPSEANSRILLIETQGAENCEIVWQMEPFMASCEADLGALRCRKEDDMLVAENPRFPYPEAPFRVAASAPVSESVCGTDVASPECSAGRNAILSLRMRAADTVVIVCGMDPPEKLHSMACPETAKRLLDQTRRTWREKCCRITVHTPDPLLDRYLNGWAAYQTLACRVLGRASVYQNGGAYGFRDQLQDAVNLLPLMPELGKKQILDACARQFPEGDVLHWWHCCPEGDRGVRTRCSDDLVWLPWALCEYTDSVGDTALCAEKVAFLEGDLLREKENNRYALYMPSENAADVLEHSFRALEAVMNRGTGAHGLLLMLGGDWNDGFDRVGEQGKGESVWLSWFFAHTAERFASLAQRLGADAQRVESLRRFSENVGCAANHAWDGGWFLRGYFDDGTPLGTQNGNACKIDSIAQSFSALCKQADPDRVDIALQSAVRELFDRENGIVRLFTPPFTDEMPDPGYISSYGPGFRENGGQYTHGALWLAMALLKRNETDEGYAVLHALLPGARDWHWYGAEPYVLAADVYATPGHEGRAGWSWYTGSAGWMLRIALQELLGLKRKDGDMEFSPRLPSAWDGFSAEFTDEHGTQHRLEVTRESCLLDGRPAETNDEKQRL